MERQSDALREWVRKTFGEVGVIEVKDIGSGLKEDRGGLKKLDGKDHMQELMEDSVEIVKSFASRIYGQEYEKVVKCVEDVEKDG